MAKLRTATPRRSDARPRDVWAGVVTIRPGWATYRGTAGDTAPHRHHAVQIALGLGDPVEVQVPLRSPLIGFGAVVAADYLHRLVSRPAPLALLYVEPESTAGRFLESWCGREAGLLSRPQHRSLVRVLSSISADVGNDLAGPVRRALTGSSETAPRTWPMDARIARSISELPRPLPARISLAELAARVGLSTSRYAHLFRAEVGLPLRPYLRWLRLREALSVIAAGESLTRAAASAGFSDSAHLSRTFRRTFGVPPRILLGSALALEGSDPGGA